MFKKLLYLFLAVSVFATSGTFSMANAAAKVPYWAQNRMVVHAGGQIGGYIYTNSREALTATCKHKRVKTVELDFMYTKDKKLVCTHDWYGVSKKYPILASFLKLKCMKRFTTMSAEQAVSILAKYNKNLIIDSKKATPARVYSSLLKICDKLDLQDYKNKMIPQFYSLKDYPKTKAKHRFKSGIYSVYKTKHLSERKLKKLIRYCKHKKLVLTVGRKRFFKYYKTLRKANLFIGVHTVNSRKLFKKATKNGASFVYSDKLF